MCKSTPAVNKQHKHMFSFRKMPAPASRHQCIKYLAIFSFAFLLAVTTDCYDSITQFMGDTDQKTRLPNQSSTGGNFSVTKTLERHGKKERLHQEFWPSNDLAKRLIIHPPKMPFAEDMNSFRIEITRRQEMMLCQCKNITRSTSTQKVSNNVYRHLHVLAKENIVYCPVIKASTSTWKRNLLRLSYLPKDKTEEWLARSPGGNQGWKRMLQHYCKNVQTKAAYESFLNSKKAGIPTDTILLINVEKVLSKKVN